MGDVLTDFVLAAVWVVAVLAAIWAVGWLIGRVFEFASAKVQARDARKAGWTDDRDS